MLSTKREAIRVFGVDHSLCQRHVAESVFTQRPHTLVMETSIDASAEASLVRSTIPPSVGAVAHHSSPSVLHMMSGSSFSYSPTLQTTNRASVPYSPPPDGYASLLVDRDCSPLRCRLLLRRERFTLRKPLLSAYGAICPQHTTLAKGWLLLRGPAFTKRQGWGAGAWVHEQPSSLPQRGAPG